LKFKEYRHNHYLDIVVLYSVRVFKKN